MVRKMKYLLPAVILAAVLFPACKMPANEAKTDYETVTDAAEETGSEAQESVQPAREPAASDGIYPIYEDDEITVSFITAEPFKEGGARCYLYLENHSSKDLTGDLSEISVNGEALFDSKMEYFYADSGKTEITPLDTLAPGTFFSDPSELTEVSFRVELMLDYEDTIMDETVTIREDAGFPFHIVCLPCLQAKAETQVLSETDEVRVTLLSLGSYPDGFFMEDELQGVIRVENLSDHVIPVKFCGLIVNGYSINATGSFGTDTLEGGNECYIPIAAINLTEQGITEISEVRLLILTDYQDNTGVESLSGGIWYQVDLSEHADLADFSDSVTGEPILTEAGCSIYEKDAVRGIGAGNYCFEFLLENTSDQDLLVKWDETAGDAYASAIGTAKVGKQAKAILKVSLYQVEEALPGTQISGRFQIYTLGKDRLLYSDETERIYTVGE